MNSNLELFAPAAAAAAALVTPRDLMGAYEALMDRGQKLSRIASALRRQPGMQLSQLVAAAEVSGYAQQALLAMGVAGLGDVGVVAHGAPLFPPLLRESADVALLYYLGRWDFAATRCIAVVGTRQPSADGLVRTALWVRLLVAEGFTIVSGLARGIDTCAHETAIAAGGRTIAVLGTPLSTVYPPENRQLQCRMAAGQLLISHVPFVRYAKQAPEVNREFFLQRNAVITGLSEATIVMEAGDRSGALVAARHALRQGRRLLIPDRCGDAASLRWPGQLLARGAVRIRNSADLRDQLALSDDAC